MNNTFPLSQPAQRILKASIGHACRLGVKDLFIHSVYVCWLVGWMVSRLLTPVSFLFSVLPYKNKMKKGGKMEENEQ